MINYIHRLRRMQLLNQALLQRQRWFNKTVDNYYSWTAWIFSAEKLVILAPEGGVCKAFAIAYQSPSGRHYRYGSL